MAKHYCNAEQAYTPKLIPTLAVLCLVSIAVLAPVVALPAAIAQRPQLQNVESTQAPGQHVIDGEVPDGLTKVDWASIQGQIAAGKYRAYQHETNGYVSTNPVHGWQIHFGADGTTTLRPRDLQAKAYNLGVKLSAVGFSELQTLDRPEQISAGDFTVTYQWNDTLREWWVNTITGLEQWFELEQRPPGAENGQPLTLDMALTTDLVTSQHGNALSFTSATGTTISYSRLSVWDASGRALPARMQMLANQLSLIIDDTEASYPLTIDPSFEQQAYIKASNTGLGDGFGTSVAVSGDTLVVGAPGEDSNATGIDGHQSDNSAPFGGAVYFYARGDAVWNQQAYIKASNTESFDNFGQSVSIFGDTLVVGAPGEDSNATGTNGDQGDNSAPDSGAVYVYSRSNTLWDQLAYIKASNTEEGDNFGFSIDAFNETFAVGAPGEDSNATGIDGDQSDNSAPDAGAVYVYNGLGFENTYGQEGYIKASNTEAGDNFGDSLALFGATNAEGFTDGFLAVGALGEDSNATGIDGHQSDNSAPFGGAVYFYARGDAVWNQQAYIKASNTESFDNFGGSIAIFEDTLVVGGAFEDSNATGINGNQDDNSATSAGAAWVFFGEPVIERTINAGHSGAWFFPNTSGQGELIEVVPEQEFIFLSLFTWTLAASANPNEQQWYTAQGNFSGNTATLDLFETLGGIFDDPQGVTTTQVGEVTLTFADCEQGQLSYRFDEGDLQGFFPLFRVIPGSENVCEDLAGTSPQAVDINAGMDGAWFDPDTPGQGFFIDSHPDPEGGNFIFVSWFTYGDDTVSGQRWLTAQVSFEGSKAEIDVFETTGGSFDDPQATSTTQVGTMSIDFTDCSNALLTYALTDSGAEGDMAITRVIPGGQALCEELAGAD